MPFPNTKALIKHSIYMLVFLTHTTILNETQVPKVSDSTMIVELEPASFLPFWLEFHVQTNGCTNTHVVSNSTFLSDRRNYFYLAGIAVSPLPTSTRWSGSNLFTTSSATKGRCPVHVLQSPKRKPSKKLLRYDFRAQRCSLFSPQSNTACTPSINMLTLTIPMPRSSLSLLT